ncbi:MAG: galactose mutarotase [Bacteroidales bacterium]|nr:galactose mutarotase [Bacteroidales bacterium]
MVGLGVVLNFIGCKSQNETKNKTKNVSKMEIIKENFGTTTEGVTVDLYTLKNNNGMIVKITNYGGIVTSLLVPDKNGNMDDVTLGFDNLQAYLDGHPYFGCIVGRYGNRIAKGKFELDGVEYNLAKNNDENHLHGGEFGFDKKIWDAEPVENEKGVGLKLHYVSVDMEEGYPGNIDVTVTYMLTDENELKINYEATIDKPCPINLTWHGYFNLTGGKENILNHEMEINANKYVVVDETLIPTGELRDLIGSEMDFTSPKTIGSRFDKVPGGYDHTYIINKSSLEIDLVARVYEPTSGRVMEVYSTEPSVQFYTGNFLDGSLTGKNEIVYEKQVGFCLETQHFPDSPNQPSFPSTILKPGEKYSQTTIYKFSTK